MRLTRMTPLVAGVVAVAVAVATPASASVGSCVNSGASTECVSPGNAEIYTSPEALPGAGHSGYGPFMGYHHGRS
ncbi:MAG: hypothetical protein WAM92_21025 [Mycobacterium sp.]